MSQSENLGEFVRDNKKILWDYWETRLEIYRLQGVRGFAKASGWVLWFLVALFLYFMLSTFAALVLAFWLSDVFDSYVIGFAITTGLIAIKIVVITLLRKQLFVNPIIRRILKTTQEETSNTDQDGPSS